MKKSRITLLTFLSTLLAIPIAYAANPHIKGPGSELTVRFAESGTAATFTVEGDFAGLGNVGSTEFLIDALGTVDGTCTNPGGGEPQGQEIPFNLTETEEAPVKNGSAHLEEIIPLSFSCKSKKMSPSIDGMTLTSLEVTVQGTKFTCAIPGDELVLTGPISTEQLTCTPS